MDDGWWVDDGWWMMDDDGWWWMMDDGWWMMDDGWWWMDDGWWMMMDDGWWMMTTLITTIIITDNNSNTNNNNRVEWHWERPTINLRLPFQPEFNAITPHRWCPRDPHRWPTSSTYAKKSVSDQLNLTSTISNNIPHRCTKQLVTGRYTELAQISRIRNRWIAQMQWTKQETMVQHRACKSNLDKNFTVYYFLLLQ